MKQVLLSFEVDLIKMPLGKLSKNQLDKTYKVLTELQTLITNDNLALKTAIVDASNRFYTLIPHDLSLNKSPLLDNIEIIKSKTEMIDNLLEIEIKTSTGDVKGIDLRDSTDSSDMDISTIIKVTSNNNRDDESIQDLSGRKLKVKTNIDKQINEKFFDKIPSSWKNSSGNYHIRIKSLKQLMPITAFERLLKERREKMFDPEHRLALAEAQHCLNEHINKFPSPNELYDIEFKKEQKSIREEFQSFVDALKDVKKKYNDPGPFLDCIVWNDGDKWILCIDTSEQGDLDQCKCLTNYIDSHEFATFSPIDMVTYSVQIHHDINILEIVVAGGSHGTHISAICAAYFGDSSEDNRISPDTQLLSINIGNHRLSTMETIPSLVQAVCVSGYITPEMQIAEYALRECTDYIRSLAKPSFISKIHLEITDDQGQGIYLKDFDHVQSNSGDTPYNEQTFYIRIDLSHLKEDQLHFTELQSIHTNQINVRSLAHFPITITKPISVNPQSHTLEFTSPTFKAGQIRRHFIQVSTGSKNIVFFKITNHSSDISAQITLHFIQLEPGRSCRLTEFEKIIRLSSHSTFQYYFNV
ncbi:unnamed protein product [Rotaria sordida]|uniref:NAD(+) ADP-ribosyltransferase n=1 Tax=Rotaria sordida TaxID=392033 RepID=A0A816BXV6_9BILA|nr:unnamed protein product [Rotaria sordida]CAF1614321.1 unnamed protein product [Rotaria sordida]